PVLRRSKLEAHKLTSDAAGCTTIGLQPALGGGKPESGEVFRPIRSHASVVAECARPRAMPLGFHVMIRAPVPEGQSTIAQRFHRWVEGGACGVSPEGTAEQRPSQPSLRNLRLSNRAPSVARWAIFIHPFGMRMLKS